MFVEKLNTTDNITITYVLESNSTKLYIGLNSSSLSLFLTVFNNTRYSKIYNTKIPTSPGIVITISVNLINSVTTIKYDICTNV